MEAVAKHQFDTQQQDEVSFPKGASLQLLEIDQNNSWLKASYNGNTGLVPSNYLEIKPHPWYMVGISRQEAEEMLLEKSEGTEICQQKDGAFIVRPSESAPGNFSLSVKCGSGVQHFKVLCEGFRYYLWQEKFNSLNELIEFHRHHSVSRSSNICLRDLLRSKVIANYDFTPNDPEELPFKRGDIIMIIDKKDPNWWTGEVERGGQTQRGLLPRTYVSAYTN